MKLVRMHQVLPFIVAGLLVSLAIGQTSRPTSRPTSPEPTRSRSNNKIVMLKLPLELPAVGNISAVKNWRFGRLESAEQTSGSADVILLIRDANGQTRRIIGPTRHLVELARRSSWFPASKAKPGHKDYVERMIAYDVDANGRLIALMSLEPTARSQSRLERAFRKRR